MYQNFFGLKEQAFSIAVNPRYLYMSRQHKEALAHLLYGVKEGGFVMLSGEVGTGKTTITRCLLEQLPENTDIAFILNPMASIRELLCTICDELHLDYDRENTGIKAITDTLQRYLLENHHNGRNTILLIDEAQLLSPEVLEQVRLLTNLETSTKKLLQIILVGQPELNNLLAQPRLRQLSQRITARFHLTPLTLKETENYIKHRLLIAGMPEDRNPFPSKIIKQIHEFTGGIPRKINVLCERILVGAYAHNKSRIDREIFEAARKEVEGYRQPIGESKLPLGWMIFCVLLIIIALGFWVVYPKFNQPAKSDMVLSQAPTPAAEPSPTPTEAKKPLEQPSAELFISNKIKAQTILFEYLEFDITSDTHPCWQVNINNIACRNEELETWQALDRLNRPVILTLVNESKFESYAVLIGLEDKYALLLDTAGEKRVLNLNELGPAWTGQVFYTWQKPADYSKPISLGERSPVVADVAEKFALLDNQVTPLATSQFNRALQTRVKIFQRDHDLEPDGILGEQTLMKLNERLSISKTLDRSFL